jgi:predicted transcriptional regulator
MIASELISRNFLTLSPSDSARRAIELFAELCVIHIPVVDNGQFLGLLHAESVIHLNEKDFPVLELKDDFITVAINGKLHSLDVFETIAKHELTSLPVVDDNFNFLGTIASDEFFARISNLYAFKHEGAIIRLVMGVRDYNLSEIARIVESENAKIVVSYIDIDEVAETIRATIKLNTNDIEHILADFERYKYTVDFYYPDQRQKDELEDRYNLLMKMLGI